VSIKRALAPLLVVALGAVAWIPWHPAPDAAAVELASADVAFEKFDLPVAESNQERRDVQPGLERIESWISSVGASVGAFDLRGLGRSGDGCLTDPRDDQLRIFPVPHSGGESFEPFELVPRGLRYDDTMAPIGCVPTDIDQDGRQDVIAYYWGRSPVIFRNVGGSGAPNASWFEAHELVTPMQVWNSTALNVADVDGDGLLDIAVGNYFPDGARVLDVKAGDDPRMEMQHSMGDAHNAGPNRLFLGQRDTDGALQFADVSERWPEDSANSWTLALGFQNLTGNGLPDMYVANDFGPDQMFVNTSTPGDVVLTEVRGNRDATTARSKVLGHDSFKGMGVVFSHAEGADLPMILVSNITTEWGLQESNLAFYPTGHGDDLLKGDMPYEDRAAEIGVAHSGWSWDIKALDLTNSGRDSFVHATGYVQGEIGMWPRLQEMAMGNDQLLSKPAAWMNLGENGDLSGRERNRLWTATGAGERYADIGSKVPFSSEDVTRGFAVADVNGDGLQDILEANQWGTSHAYINRGSSENSWVTLAVTQEGEYGSTPLVGATVTVTGHDYERVAQVFPANGHSGVSGPELHLAIPESSLRGATATVEWLDEGVLQTQRFRLERGAQELKVTP
jgi:enediyne biosynthesis protein E4